MKRLLAAILHADVVGFSRLTNLDEGKTYKYLREGLDLLSSLIVEFEGKKIKEAGDSILAEFQSVIAAVECAVEFQRQMLVRNEGATEDNRLEFRVGINLGEVIHDRNDIYGDGVNLAARLQEHADPGCVNISGSVYEQIKGKVGQEFDDLGYQKVKNFVQPVHIYKANIPGNRNKQELNVGWGTSSLDRSSLITGRCMCGNVRYESSEPPLTNSYCHCRMCQRANSAPFAAWTVFQHTSVRFPNAEPKYFQSSPIAERGFCPNCGASMTMRFIPHEPDGVLAIFTMTLDHPEDFAPTYHSGIESQLPWIEIYDDLPRKCTVDFINARKRWEAAGVPDPDDWKLSD